MPVSDADHLASLRAADTRRLDDLRSADRRAVELPATANAAKFSAGLIISSILVSICSVGVAVAALVLRH